MAAELKEETKTERFLARVASWNNQRRFGFLENPNPHEPDIFVHLSSLGGRQRLICGEIVEFTYSTNSKGKTAVDVVVVESKAKPVSLNLNNKDNTNEQPQQ